MPADLLLKAAIAIAPVLILLFVFDRLDVFDLIPMREIGALLATGAALALLSFIANWRVLDGFPIGWSAFTRYVSPIIEESLKAAPLIALYARNRLGFKIEAAIAGFAVGAGFSVAENLWYLTTLSGTNATDWLVRGFGTAIMHGAASALFAVISHEMLEKQAAAPAAQYRFDPIPFAPGLAVAMACHSLFNHFPGQPLMAMVATAFLAPLILFSTLAQSERATRVWLASDAAAHRVLLEDIRAGRFWAGEQGQALRADLAALRNADAGQVFAYVELKLELVLRAEELMLSTHDGGQAALGAGVREKIGALDRLERQLGRAVTAAVSSRLGLTRNDLYELGRLRARAR